MKERKRPSVIPIYAVAVLFVLYNLFFPMYRLWHFLLCAAVCALAYGLLLRRFPGEIEQIPEEEQPPDTGNEELDAVIAQQRAMAAKLCQLQTAIQNPDVSASLDQITALTGKILQQVRQQPEKLPKIRRTMNYFLPTTLKLAEKYAALQAELNLSNVQTMLVEIRQVLAKMTEALQKQLDQLYEHDVVDITAEIQVMEQMLRAQGLENSKDFS